MASDSQLIFRDSSDGSLTADETTAAIDLGVAPLNGLPVRVWIPTDGGAGDKLDIIFTTCDTSGGTYQEDDRISWDFLSQADHTKTLAGIYRRRVNTHRRYLKVTFDVTDGGGGVDFGAVDCRVEDAGEGTNTARDL